MEAIKISLFYVENEEGIALRNEILKIIDTDFQDFDIQVQSFSSLNSTQKDVNKSSLYDDLVIFDASVEKNHNYNCATEQPKVLEHILVISRTYLPINFHGIRKGGYPNFPEIFSNDEILVWLKNELTTLIPSYHVAIKELEST